MKKFEGILFASDLDGTLLMDDKTVSEENLKAIEYFKENGGTFIFVTGRLPVNAEEIAKRIKPNGACGCLNGGGIYDYNEKRYIWKTCLDEDVIPCISYVYDNYPSVGIEINTPERIYFVRKNPSVLMHMKNEGFPDLTAHFSQVHEPFAKILFGEKIEFLEKVINEIKALPVAAKYDIMRTDEEYYEIMPKGIHKGVIINKLREYFPEIKKIVAAGDSHRKLNELVFFFLFFATTAAKALQIRKY